MFFKIKIEKLIGIFIGLILLSIPFFIDFLKTPIKFNFSQNQNEQIFILPEENKAIIDFLNKAEKNVDITIYLLSDRKIIEKLKYLKNKGLNINIILEKTPFGGGSSNYKTFNELNNIGINIKYSEPKFALTHAKYIILDKQKVLIMTSNLTYSGLNKDRDFIFYTSDENIVGELNNIFESDFYNKKYYSKFDNLVISPDNSREKIESLINSANKSIYLYGENIKDKKVEELLINKANNGLDIKLILPDSKKLEDNIPVIDKLKKSNIKISNLKNPYQHAKILIIDNSIMYIGSINFSSQSMDRNREVGIITINKDSISKILKTFNKDFK